MIIAGIVLIIVGTVSIVYGVLQNDSIEVQLESIWESGTKDPGNLWIIIGAAIAILGIVLLIVGLTKRNRTDRAISTKACKKCGIQLANNSSFCPRCGTPINEKTIEKPVRTCPKCKAEQEKGAAFCRLCGTSLTEPKTVPETKSVSTSASIEVSASWSGPAKDKGDRNAICPHCGARQSSGNTNCKYCGTPMR